MGLALETLSLPLFPYIWRSKCHHLDRHGSEHVEIMPGTSRHVLWLSTCRPSPNVSWYLAVEGCNKQILARQSAGVDREGLYCLSLGSVILARKTSFCFVARCRRSRYFARTKKKKKNFIHQNWAIKQNRHTNRNINGKLPALGIRLGPISNFHL